MDNRETHIPQLRFPAFSGGWEEKKFKDITFPVGKRNRHNLPYERYSISNEVGFYPQNEQFEDGGGYLKDIDCRQYIIVPPKSFAYNPARINVGSIGYQDLGKEVIVSSLYEVFQTKADCDDSFLWQWFHTDLFHKMVVNVQEGGVRQYFYYEKLKDCVILLPSISEQRRIAECLGTVDQIISDQQQKVESLKAYKKGLMQQLFPLPGETTPRLRFPGFTGEWEEKTFSDLCNTVTPPLKLQSRDYLKHGKYPIVDQSQDLICGWTDDESGVISDNPVIIFGDHTCVLKFIAFPFVQGADGVKILKTLEGYWPQFVFQSFLANPVNPDGYKRHFSDLKEKSFMFPRTPSEQETIADCLATLDSIIAAETKKLESLKTHKRGLMQQLFPQPNK